MRGLDKLFNIKAPVYLKKCIIIYAIVYVFNKMEGKKGFVLTQRTVPSYIKQNGQ